MTSEEAASFQAERRTEQGAPSDAERSRAPTAGGEAGEPGAGPSERELDEVALFLTVARRGGEPGPESWLYVPPQVAAPRLPRRGLVGSRRSAVG